MIQELDNLLEKVARMKASDLHLSEGEEPIIRIQGELISLCNSNKLGQEKDEALQIGTSLFRRQLDFSVAEHKRNFGETLVNADQLFNSILPQNQRLLLHKNGECDFAYATQSGQRFRINLYHSRGKLSAAIRVIPERIPTCEELGLPLSVQKLSELQSGLVLITGATGSGKSTTMAAIINQINHNRSAHILTLEDPMEYQFIPEKSLIHQREVGTDTLSFASGIRAALREDPDIVMIGELRDLETMAIAVTAAETGHLIFATLHTRSAAETINRMIDVFPESQQRQIRIQLSGSLQAVVSQQLLPDNRGHLVAAFEVMIVTPALRNLIREGKSQMMESYIQTGAQYGMQTMEDAVAKLKKEGRI